MKNYKIELYFSSDADSEVGVELDAFNYIDRYGYIVGRVERVDEEEFAAAARANGRPT